MVLLQFLYSFFKLKKMLQSSGTLPNYASMTEQVPSFSLSLMTVRKDLDWNYAHSHEFFSYKVLP